MKLIIRKLFSIFTIILLLTAFMTQFVLADEAMGQEETQTITEETDNLSLEPQFPEILQSSKDDLFEEEEQLENDDVISSGSYGNNLTWELNGEGILTISGEGAMQDYSWNDRMATPWYEVRESVREIQISQGITTIGSCAFFSFTSLESIILPDSINKIGEDAFDYCSSLNHVHIPFSIKNIGDYAFYQCTGLTDIILDEGVQTIGQHAFENCAFSSIILPSSLKQLGISAFYGCTFLESIVLPEGFTEISSSVFAHCSSLNEVIFPSTLTKIGSSAFADCGFQSLVLPTSIKTIGGRAFAECAQLTEVEFTGDLSTIGEKAFISCPLLQIVRFSSQMTFIGDYMFSGCTSLETVSLSDSIQTINKYAFSECTSLKSISFGNSLVKIGDYAFSECRNLEQITIPDSVSEIGSYAFRYCNALTKVTLPESLTKLNTGTFVGCAFVFLRVPSGVQSMGSFAVSQCENLISIEIPSSVTVISKDAVNNCPNAVIWGTDGSAAETYAEEQGFEFHISCTSHDLEKHESVNYTCTEDGTIEYWTCRVCGKHYSDENAKTEITIEQTILPSAHRWDEGTIIEQDQNTKVQFVQYQCRECQEMHYTFEWPEDYLTGGKYGFFYWSIDGEGTLKISGEGRMSSNSTNTYPWYDYRQSVKKIEIYDGITNVPASAFRSYPIEELFLSDSIQEIGSNAFANCLKLKEIHFPASLKKIDSYAFYSCSALTDISLSHGTAILDNRAFCNCTKLASVILPATVRELNETFEKSGLTDVYYQGTERQWDEISIQDTDALLENVQIHFIDPPESISLSGETELIEGDCIHLNVVYEKGIDYFITEFTSSDPSVASVDEDGNVYAWKEGQTTITGAFEGTTLADSIDITVIRKIVDREREEVVISDSQSTSSNVNLNNYSNYGTRVYSYLTPINDTTLMRVATTQENVEIEYLDQQGIVTSKLTVPMELPLFGGFLAGEAGDYYLAFGDTNPDEDDEKEVLRFIKYDKNWNRIAACSIKGFNTTVPFSFGSLRMEEADGVLYVATCHQMYTSQSDGKRHQSNAGYVINESNMRMIHASNYPSQPITKVTGDKMAYVSHSFNQFVRMNNEYVYYVDHGDAYPRAITISSSRLMYEETPNRKELNILHAFEIPGETGDNYTGVSIGGFELSPNCGLIAFNYDIPDSRNRNIYISSVNLFTGKTESIPITNYTVEDLITCRTPVLIKISDWRFLLMWEERHTNPNNQYGEVSMIVLDGYGRPQGEIVRSKDFQLSDCQPIVLSDGTVSWYVANGSEVHIYNIDPLHLNENKAHFPVTVPGAEPTCVNTGLTEGRQCSVCGEILVAQEVIPARHTFSDPEWTWSSDYSTATAAFHCLLCGHVDIVEATVDQEIIGTTVLYTATVIQEGIEYTDTQTRNHKILITKQPEDVSIVPGASASFSVEAAGDGLTYQWYYRLAGADHFTRWKTRTVAEFSYVPKEDKDGMEAYCLITDSEGNMLESDTVTLTFLASPITITRQPENVNIVLGENAVFSVEAEGDGLKYQWYYRLPGKTTFTLWKGKTGAEFSYVPKADKDGMEVRCLIRDSEGNEATSEIVTLTFIENPITITRQPEDVRIVPGVSASFRVEAEGDGLTYQWYYRLPGKTTFTLWKGKTEAGFSYVPKEDKDGMEVRCLIRDNAGNEATSDTVTLTFMANPITITKQPKNVNIVLGAAAAFSVIAEGDELTYQWYYKLADTSSFRLWKNRTDAEFSYVPKADKNDMEVFCAITDAAGNTRISDTVTMTITQ